MNQTQTESALVTRRRIIIGTTALAVGGAGLALGTDRAGAQADITLGTISVDPGQFSPSDGEVHDIWVLLDCQYSYRVPSDPSTWQAFLLVGDGSGDTEAVALTDGTATNREDSGSFGIKGSLTAPSYYSTDDFRLGDGEQEKTITIPITVVFLVQNANGDTLIDARETTDAVVTIDDTGMPHASLGASGTLVAQEDESDPEPSLGA